MLEYQLFFGRGSVTEQAWTDFAAGVVTPHLPDGFTVVDADGQWMNPATHRISSERTKVIVVAVPDTAGQRRRDRSDQGRLPSAVPSAVGRHHHPPGLRRVLIACYAGSS